MITISQEIPPVTFSGNPVPVYLQSDNFIQTPGNYAQNWLSCAAGNFPAPGDTMDFDAGGASHVFVFSAAPDNSGHQLPSRFGGESAIDYCVRLKNAFNKNYLLSTMYDIVASSMGATGLVVFAARQYGPIYEFTSYSAAASGITHTLAGPGVIPVYQPNFKILVQVRKSGIIVGEELLSIDASGRAVIDVSDYLKQEPLFNWGPAPFYAENFSYPVRFQIGYAEVYGEPPEVDGFTLSNEYTVLPGGYYDEDFRKRMIQNRTSWTSYRLNHVGAPRFLTNHPGGKVTYRNSYEKLFALIRGYKNIDLTIYYSDGSQVTTTPAIFSVGADTKVFELNTSMESMGVLTAYPTKTAISYKLGIVGNLGEEAAYVYHISYERPVHLRQYLFLNKLGGWELVNATGGITVGTSTDQESFIPVGYNDLFSNRKYQKVDREETDFAIIGRSGYMRRDEALWFTELIGSAVAYEVIDGQLYSIGISGNQEILNEGTDGEYLHAFEFTYNRGITPIQPIGCADCNNLYPQVDTGTHVGCWGNLPQPPASVGRIITDAGNPIITDDYKYIILD